MKKKYGSKSKSQVALEVRRARTIAEIASEYPLHPNLVSQWKKKLMSEAAELFATRQEKQEDAKYPEDELLRKIVQLNVENDFLRKKITSFKRILVALALAKCT